MVLRKPEENVKMGHMMIIWAIIPLPKFMMQQMKPVAEEIMMLQIIIAIIGWKGLQQHLALEM